MATARKPAVDPLVEELPPAPEQRPSAATDVSFQIQISPYVAAGKHFFRWVVLEHTHKGYVGDYAGHGESGFYSVSEAERGAREYVARVRQAVELKLNAPESIILTM